MSSIHWFEPSVKIPSEYCEGYVGDLVGTIISERFVEDAMFDIKFKAGCKYTPFPLGQVQDEDGLMHYMFVIHPKDTERYSLARYDTRYRGEFSWAAEETRYSSFPDELLDFIF